ncbi:MAG: tellurite resistance TerB C-terminal domain-containing protein [Hassallia sp.]
MQSAMVNNRFLLLGIVAFSVSFGLSLVPTWDFSKAFLTGAITVIASYAAALFVDNIRRNHEMLVLGSLHKRIKELEGLKSRLAREINQIEQHRALLYTESNQLQNQVSERRNQRDSFNRELGSFVGQKKQLEAEINLLKTELTKLDKSKVELNNSFSALTAEKRRLELNSNVSRAEITKLQTQISELQQEKQDTESNLTLLDRLKPQLEERLYELRVELQELENQVNQHNELILTKKSERENIEASLNLLKTQITEQKTELNNFQEQVLLLQQERDLLQSQVWELLQQTETYNQQAFRENDHEEDVELFPFSDLIDLEPISQNIPDLPQEWTKLLEQLPGYEIQVLKAIVEQENPKAAIKQIAEINITMPNLLIDSINKRANDTIEELIINPNLETPQIYPDQIKNVKEMIAMYELTTRQPSSN